MQTRVLIRVIHLVDSGTGPLGMPAAGVAGSAMMPTGWVEMVGQDLQLGCQSGVTAGSQLLTLGRLETHSLTKGGAFATEYLHKLPVTDHNYLGCLVQPVLPG